VPVGRYAANPFGLHDMHGNVWEWVEDCFANTFSGLATNGSASTAGDCSRRVLRGGTWVFSPQNLRSALRGLSDPTDRGGDIGFRLARTL